MIDLSVDLDALSAIVSSALGRKYRLTPLNVKCTYPVFRGEAEGASPIFVKIGTKEEWRRTANLLRDIGQCGFFAELLTDSPLAYGDYAVFVSAWREAKIVFPEDMTERQIESFAVACETLSQALQAAQDVTPSADSPERLFADVCAYIRRHPIAGRLLKTLAEIPAASRTFGNRPRFVVHGDFHAKNFGFRGETFSSVFDFDKLTLGLACGDMTNALVERFSCLGLSSSARERLRVATRRIVARAPWPREEFVISANVLRLGFAARRLRKHPHSAWVALDVLRRDRKICEFLSCLEK